jgi:Rrf2 family nitric oxide-sensitive transcriptional repressor
MFLALAEDQRFSAREISLRFNISTHHVAKISQWLVHQGHIGATRGKGGGLMLARKAEDINIGAVIREAEKGSGLVECMRNDSACAIDGPCGLTGILAEAQEAFFSCLDQYTLQDTIASRTKLMRLLDLSQTG